MLLSLCFWFEIVITASCHQMAPSPSGRVTFSDVELSLMHSHYLSLSSPPLDTFRWPLPDLNELDVCNLYGYALLSHKAYNVNPSVFFFVI